MLGFVLPDVPPLVGRTAADARFDGVDLGDALQRLGRNRRAGGLMEVVEFTPHMRPAEGQCHRAFWVIPGEAVEAVAVMWRTA